MYTSEVLAVVMQQLMEQSPLPMLLMRTVIQSLTMYPRLGGFVMNILARLIMKQVTCPGPRQSATVRQTSGAWKAGSIRGAPALLAVFLTTPSSWLQGDTENSWGRERCVCLSTPLLALQDTQLS